MTEAEVLALLRRKLLGNGRNGEAVAYLEHVRDSTGFNGPGRTIDAVAMGVWPSRGLVLSGYEVKCSRKDWLRELRDPSKADGIASNLDRMWLVVSDPEIIHPGELPPKWGLMAVRGTTQLRGVTAAEPLWTEDASISRSFLAALLRSAIYVGDATPAEVREAVEAAEARLRDRNKTDLDITKDRLRQLQERVHAFEKAAGIGIEWGGDVGAVGEAVRVVLSNDQQYTNLRRQLERIQESAQRLADRAGEEVEALGSAPDQEER